jgi:predicted lipid-binding transport protein (Tim44 family)
MDENPYQPPQDSARKPNPVLGFFSRILSVVGGLILGCLGMVVVATLILGAFIGILWLVSMMGEKPGP